VFGDSTKGAEAFAVLDRFVEAGGTMIDTADVYSAWALGHKGGESDVPARRVAEALVSGFLTGKYRTEADFGKSKRGDRMPQYLNARGLRVLAALDAVAAECHATPAQVALAWLAAKPGVTAPIASANRVEQLEELLGAMELELGADQVARLDTASNED